MKKILGILALSLLLSGNALALKFEKCFVKWVDDKDTEKMMIEQNIFGKFNDLKFEEKYYRVFKDGTAEQVQIQTDKWNKEQSKIIDKEYKDVDWATPETLAKMKKKIRTFNYKVIFANENYIKLESTGRKLPGVPPMTATLNLENAEISITSWTGEVTTIKQCKISGKGKKGILDYWWAVILIIAITFFIFTQSGKRLKQIRRK